MLPVVLFFGLLGCATSFKVDFWGGAQCTGKPEGTFTHTQVNECFTIPANAEAATIEDQGSGDKGKSE